MRGHVRSAVTASHPYRQSLHRESHRLCAQPLRTRRRPPAARKSTSTFISTLLRARHATALARLCTQPQLRTRRRLPAARKSTSTFCSTLLRARQATALAPLLAQARRTGRALRQVLRWRRSQSCAWGVLNPGLRCRTVISQVLHQALLHDTVTVAQTLLRRA